MAFQLIVVLDWVVVLIQGHTLVVGDVLDVERVCNHRNCVLDAVLPVGSVDPVQHDLYFHLLE